jgi:hypothetical protein
MRFRNQKLFESLVRTLWRKDHGVEKVGQRQNSIIEAIGHGLDRVINKNTEIRTGKETRRSILEHRICI